jgi:anthranilate synthase component 1
MKTTSFDEFKELARRGTFVPVCKEIVADLLTPVSAFLKIAEHADYAFLLESVEGGEHVGRYSFLGKDPFLILRSRDGRTTLDRGGASTESDRPFIETLRGLMADFRSPFVPDLPRFTGGAVGYLGYGAASWFEPVLGDLGGGVDGADQAGFMLFDTCSPFDHVQHRILIIANARITADDDLESLYQFARAKIEFLERELEREPIACAPGNRQRAGIHLEPHPGTFRGAGPRREGAHRGRRHLPGRSVAAVRAEGRGRSLHRVPRAPAREPVTVHVFHPNGRRIRGRVVA